MASVKYEVLFHRRTLHAVMTMIKQYSRKILFLLDEVISFLLFFIVSKILWCIIAFFFVVIILLFYV